jgi:2-polyprenyl-3-methyl-5-hydroxy-6-metoxy-1,4-benzoquinol methylase
VTPVKRLIRPIKHVDGSDPAYYDSFYRTLSAEASTDDGKSSDDSRSSYVALRQELASRLLGFQYILEVGCGTGQLAHMLKDLGVRAYTGFDFSAEAIAIACGHLDADLRVADAMTTDLFETIPYDAVVMTEVLEHLPDDLGLLARIRPGTHVFATVPGFDDPAHVRYFFDVSEVQRRYKRVLSSMTVEPFRRSFYVIHGVS